MESLLYLYKLKAWGFIRNIFKKPLSAIFTVLAILFFVAIYIAMFMVSAEMEEKLPFELFGIFFLAFSLFMGVAMLFQKRTALLSMSDAHYLLIGPFKRQHIFLSAIMGSMGGALLYGVMAYAYSIAFFSPLFDFQVFDYFWILIVALAVFYFIFILIDFSYIRFLGHTHQRAIRVLVISLIVIITLSVFGYYCLRYYTIDLSKTFLSFITSDLFNFTPFFGWANAAIYNMHNGNIVLKLFSLKCVAFQTIRPEVSGESVFSAHFGPDGAVPPPRVVSLKRQSEIQGEGPPSAHARGGSPPPAPHPSPSALFSGG